MITRDDLKQIVFNSRIALSEEEMDEFTQKMNETIDMVSIINEIDLTAIEPMFYPNEHLADFRDPTLEMVTKQSDLLANTATVAGSYFKVPAVLKDGES
jgi:aspartyl/glutamyl-tRNA(Asn/Gln) amidotransferase C subunit